MKYSLKIILVLGLISQKGWGGGSIGNGGDAVVCRSSENRAIGTVELLDSYEGREYYGIDSDWGSKEATPIAQIKYVLDRYARQDSGRAQNYLKRAQEFLSTAKFKPGVVFTDIPDSQHLFFPENCKVEQIAIQMRPQFPEEPRYLVQEELWKRLDNRNKAILVLHEVIYREALDMGHENSIPTRYFVSLIGSTRWSGEPLSEEAYFQTVLKKLSLPFYHKDLRLIATQSSFYEGELRWAHPFIAADEEEIPISAHIVILGRKAKIDSLSRSDYFEFMGKKIVGFNSQSKNKHVEIWIQGKIVSLSSRSGQGPRITRSNRIDFWVWNANIAPVVLKTKWGAEEALSGARDLLLNKDDLICADTDCN